MNFNLFAFLFVFAWLAQLYTSEKKSEPEVKTSSDLEVGKTGKTIPMEDYKSMQAFEYFVYPSKYSKSMFNNTIMTRRNITLDKINYLPPANASAADNESLFRIVDDESFYRQNYPTNYYNYDQGYQGYQPVNPTQPMNQPHFLNQGTSMVNLIDPLFLMATLAFVVFLINSVLGLVSKLNLPLVGGGSKRNRPFEEITDDGERDQMNDEIFDEIESIFRNALYEIRKHLN